MPAEPRTESLLPTRQSLLGRLKDCEDQEGWSEFFETYWRLIYKAARQAGLDEDSAQEVVQSTFIYLSRRMPRFHYDPALGSFKAWLLRVTRSRISALRRRAEGQNAVMPDVNFEGREIPLWERIPDPSMDCLDDIWQREWEEHLLQNALRRLRARISAQQLLMFELAVLDEIPPQQVARKLEVSLMQVYLARHRVGKMFKAEVARLRRESE